MELLVLTILLGFCVHSSHPEITKENILKEKCFYDTPQENVNKTICTFMTGKLQTPKQSDHDCLHAKEHKEHDGFCMKVQIKPLKDDPCLHEFEIGAINVKENYWIGIGISSDEQMYHDYGFYCSKGKSYLGLLNNRDPVHNYSAILNVEEEEWRPNPVITITNKYEEIISKKSKDSLYFIRCGFTTAAFHWSHPEYHFVRLGSGGWDKQQEARENYTLLMAAGIKKSTDEKKGLFPNDFHAKYNYGLDPNILNGLKAKDPAKCASATEIDVLSKFLVIFSSIAIHLFAVRLFK